MPSQNASANGSSWQGAISPEDEKLIQEACLLLRAVPKPNYAKVIRDIQKQTGVALPYHTVRNRFLGKHVPPWEAHTGQQLLTPGAEKALIDWITFLSETGHPLNKRTIRKKAEALCGKKPSHSWVHYFLGRHPEIKLCKPSSLDPKRAQAFNKHVVNRHFDLLIQVIQKFNIPIENIYNMDEKGCQRGGGRKNSGRRYFVHRARRSNYRARSGNLELVTVIECVCANGTYLLPGFVFSGKEFSSEWFSVDPGIGISMSENGWTDDFLCKEWFKNNFIPQATARNTSHKPILLIYDGHGSHDTLELIHLARENNIILFCLPPHTTHKLQPLDVGVFGPFARAWVERCDEIVEDTGEEMPREDFVKEYMQVRGQSFKSTTIITAFRKSGCWPVNRDVFSDEDFATSVPTSTSARHVPNSFPLIRVMDGHNNNSDSGDESLHCPGRDYSDSSSSDNELPDDNEVDNIVSESQPISTVPGPRPVSLPISDAIAPSQQPIPTLPGASAHPSLPPLLSVPVANAVPSPLTIHKIVPKPIPASTFYASNGSTKRKRTSVINPIQPHLDALSQAYTALQDQNLALRSENSTLRAHCVIAGTEIQDLRRRLNAKENRPSKRQKLNVDARWLNSDEGLRLAEEYEAVRLADEQKKRSARELRAAKEAEREVQRQQRDPNTPFTGRLNSKSKADLQDVAHALGLSMDGQKKDLLERIKAYFDANTTLRDHPHYEGLFHRVRNRPVALQAEAEASNLDASSATLVPVAQF